MPSFSEAAPPTRRRSGGGLHPAHRAGTGLAVLLGVVLGVGRARGQEPTVQANGFAVERFYPSAPGGGFFVMDTLDMHGTLGGAVALTVGDALRPLRIGEGAQSFSVVSNEAFASFGFAATLDRYRLHVAWRMPLVITGQDGVNAGYSFKAPSVDLGSNPDTLADARLGFDIRLVGGWTSPLRFGASVLLFIPNGQRGDYDTDGTYRAMGLLRFVADSGAFTMAGQVGMHVRPLDQFRIQGGPKGNELLFGIAAGARIPIDSDERATVVLGPEFYGVTALRSFLGTERFALEGLLTGRIELVRDDGRETRVKLGGGVGIVPEFGAPTARFVVAVELLGRTRTTPR